MTENVANTPIFAPSALGFTLDGARPILAHENRFAPGAGVHPHSHPRAQLLWAMDGVLRVSSDDSVWIVPPSHAVWIPGGTVHAVTCETEATFRNLYIDPSLALGPERATNSAACQVVLLSPLLRELILMLVDQDMTGPFSPRLMRLVGVIADEIAALVPAPLYLPGGHDPRLVRLTQHLGRHPADQSPLADLARLAGASLRTVERLFRTETGLTFRQWRARLRLLSAIERLDAGQSSKAIAHALGYQTASAFVAAFRDQFGVPPQSYLRSMITPAAPHRGS